MSRLPPKPVMAKMMNGPGPVSATAWAAFTTA